MHRYLSTYKHEVVKEMYDFCCAACSYHIKENTTHALVKCPKKDREAVKPLIVNFFRSETELDLIRNSSYILEYDARFITW